MDIRVGILRGGTSHNRDFSLRSGAHVITLVDRTKFKPIDIVVSSDNKWLIEGKETDAHKGLEKIDVIFNTLLDASQHKIIEQFNIPQTGGPHLSSSITHNKLLTKKILASHGVPVKFPKHIELISKELGDEKTVEKHATDIIKKINFPIIIKPSHGGTSLGVTLAHSFHDVIDGVTLASKLAPSVIVEEFISGKEINATIVDHFRNTPHYISLPVHIIPEKGELHLHAESKFTQSFTTESPAKLSDAQKKEVGDVALDIHKLLGLKHISSTDFILHPKKGLYFIETNTVPLFHKDAHVFEGIKAAGGTERELINHLIASALKDTHHIV